MTRFFSSHLFIASLHALLIVIAIAFACNDLSAQTIDPYSRLTNPRAIANLGGTDGQPLRHRAGYGFWSTTDSFQHQRVLAEDSGAGIITHLWVAASVPDSVTSFRVYIDGTLAVSSYIYDFFGLRTGALRPPFDSNYPGGNVCDVQMPYQKSFKITFDSPSDNFYYAITWRPVSDPKSVTPFALYESSLLLQQQQLGEKAFLSLNSPWSNDTSITQDISGGILGHDTSVVFDEAGPALIQSIRFHPGTYDPAILDSLVIRMYWDDRPTPAVDVPINDFFGASTGAWTNHSHWLRVEAADGYTSYFPMPFAHHGRIVLVNLGSNTIPFTGSIQWGRESVPAGDGYFCARFSESNPTKYAIFHPVLHEYGRGRYVGMNWSIPNNPSPVALEGDPYINVDSSSANMIHYTGSEDYLNGGWWFFGAVFTAPFSGFTHVFDSFYRMHVLDAVDLDHSIDYLLQHGVNNDVHDDYRTVAYYYLHWTPFWAERDTVRSGESWKVGGVGYQANAPIAVALGAKNLWSMRSDAMGKFSLDVTIPNSLGPGSYPLSVNGESQAREVVVLAQPTLRILVDSTPVTVRYGDTIALEGVGFRVGERITLYLDSIPTKMDTAVTVGDDYRFHATLRIPYLPDWHYHVTAIGSISGRVVLDRPITLTRNLVFEFEDLIPFCGHTPGDLIYNNVSYYWHAKWSKQTFALFKPTGTNGFALFKFNVPHDDTFSINLLATIGPKYGKYAISLDGRQIAVFDGYKVIPYFDADPSDTIRAGVFFLTKDIHFIQWSSLGKDDSATDQWLGADNVMLHPTTHLPLAPGTFIQVQRTAESPLTEASSFTVFPQPCTASMLGIHVSLGQQDSRFARAQVGVDILDILGRKLRTLALTPLTSDESTVNFDVQDLTPGTYFCRLDLSANGNTLERILPFQKTK